LYALVNIYFAAVAIFILHFNKFCVRKGKANRQGVSIKKSVLIRRREVEGEEDDDNDEMDANELKFWNE